MVKTEWNVLDPSHSPCDYNKCDEKSTCVLNTKARFGYNCICEYPYIPDPKIEASSQAGYGDNNGCKVIDLRNHREKYRDGKILFGGK